MLCLLVGISCSVDVRVSVSDINFILLNIIEGDLLSSGDSSKGGDSSQGGDVGVDLKEVLLEWILEWISLLLLFKQVQAGAGES